MKRIIKMDQNEIKNIILEIKNDRREIIDEVKCVKNNMKKCS